MRLLLKKYFLCAIVFREAAGDFMSVRYHEWRGPKKEVRRVPAFANNAEENPEFISWLTRFINDDASKRARVNIPKVICADFEKIGYKYPRLNFSCSIPDAPQSIYNNLSTFLMDKVERQLRPFHSDNFVGLVVCDGGNQFISDPLRTGGWGAVSAAEIMNHVVSETDVDFIVCLGRKDEMDMTGMVIFPMNTVKKLSFHMFANQQFRRTRRKDSMLLSAMHFPGFQSLYCIHINRKVFRNRTFVEVQERHTICRQSFRMNEVVQ